MLEDPIIGQLREAIRKWSEKSPDEQFASLVESGVIDNQGKVLLRVPQPPKSSQKNAAKKKRVKRAE